MIVNCTYANLSHMKNPFVFGIMRLLALLLLLPQFLYAQENKFDKLFLEADSLFQKGEFKKSSILLDQAFLLNYEPDNGEYYHAARIYSLANKIDKSLNYLEKAIGAGFGYDFIMIYDKTLENIRNEKRYKAIELKLKNGAIGFFDIIKQMESQEEVVYYNKRLLLHDKSIQYVISLNDKITLKTRGLADYSYHELLNRAGREDFNFKDKNLTFSNSHLGNALIPYLNLRKLSIIGCDSSSIEISHCEIGKMQYGIRSGSYGGSTFNKLDYLNIINSKYDTLIIYDDFTRRIKIDSVEVRRFTLWRPNSLRGIKTILEDLEITNSKIGLDANRVFIEVHSTNTLIESNLFETNVTFGSSEFLQNVEIVDNSFNGYLDIGSSFFPEFYTYLPFRQVKKGLYLYNRDTAKNYYPTGDKLGDITMFEKLINSYQYLFNNYKLRGEIESEKECNIAIKNLYVKRYRHTFKSNDGISNYFKWKQAQFLIWHLKNKTFSILSFTIIAIVLVLGIVKIKSKKQKPIPAEKRLAALVFSDIVGYTSLMGKDEKKALKILDINRSLHVIMCNRHNGELLKEMGDGMLCSFQTASGSVKFCINVQREIAQQSDFSLRMGVHLGEVAFSKNDVFGDGVNIASRLQGEAKEGGICISETVYQNIRNQPDIEVEFIGERELKNVTSKVKMYEVKY